MRIERKCGKNSFCSHSVPVPNVLEQNDFGTKPVHELVGKHKYDEIVKADKSRVCRRRDNYVRIFMESSPAIFSISSKSSCDGVTRSSGPSATTVPSPDGD